MIIDADTIPLRKTSFFDYDKPIFVTEKEYFKSYFDTIDVLFDGKIKRVDENVSYISEAMIFNKECVLELINDIEGNTAIKGKSYWEKIINAMKESDGSFSEFETYGNYVDIVHPCMYVKRKEKYWRNGSGLFGKIPNELELKWAGKYFERMTFEGGNIQYTFMKNSIVRKFISAKTFYYIWKLQHWVRYGNR